MKNIPSPSEGLDASPYNPGELEEWKKKIYGLEYYDDEVPAAPPIWNQSSSDSNNSNNSKEDRKWQRIIYGDDYFDKNIAAITNNWEDEDANGPTYRRKLDCNQYLQDYFKESRRLMYIVVVALVATMVATIATVLVARNDYLAATEPLENAATNYNNNNNNNEPTVYSTDPSMMFETRKADHIFQEDTPTKKHGGHRRNMLRIIETSPAAATTGN